jgi:RNA polymerase sigma-70 factor (ECF subfamily)
LTNKKFDEIYFKFKGLEFNISLQYLQNVQVVEEVTQDVFVKIHFKLYVYRNKAKLRIWVYCDSKSNS